MKTAFFVISILIINLVLWIVLIFKFKKLFSTDKILSSTNEEVTKMIERLNKVTSRNIDLIEAKLKELKVVSAEADRHIAIAKKELEKQTQENQFQKIISEASVIANSSASEKREIPNSKRVANEYTRISDGFKSEESISLTEKGKMAASTQGELFGEEKFVESSVGTKFTMDNTGASVASIAKLAPNVTIVDDLVVPKKSVNQKIIELNNSGYPVEYIAKTLNITTSEVQFALDMDM